MWDISIIATTPGPCQLNSNRVSTALKEEEMKTTGRIGFALVACLLIIGVTVGCYHQVRKGSAMVLGKKTWEEWKAEAGWKSYSAEAYQPPEGKIRTISDLGKSKNATFVVFGGSWCPDTIKQLPMIYKIFALASIPPNKVDLYGVDRKKKDPSGTAEKFGIQKVPTLVILANGNEVGRIVEYPQVSWEDDIIALLSK
jgi:thiol-disulfide isomerase/thioredoxin